MTVKIYEDLCDIEDPRGRWVRAEEYELAYRALELCNNLLCLYKKEITKLTPNFWIAQAEADFDGE